MNKKKFKETVPKDDYWMALAFIVAAGSPSNNRQACILVDQNNEFINLSHDSSSKFSKNEEHSVPAELNAIFSSSATISGTAYITYTPSYNSVVALVSSGVRRIVYFSTKTLDSKCTEAVYCTYGQIEAFKGNLNWMRDYINTIDVFN